MARILASALLLAVLVTPAHAGQWLKSCDAAKPMANGAGLRPGEYACYQPASNSDDSVLLNVAACENEDYKWFLDRNGDTTASTVTPTLRSCPASLAASDSDACPVVAGNTFDGTVTKWIYGAGEILVFVDMPGSGTIADPEMTAECNGPKL